MPAKHENGRFAFSFAHVARDICFRLRPLVPVQELGTQALVLGTGAFLVLKSTKFAYLSSFLIHKPKLYSSGYTRFYSWLPSGRCILMHQQLFVSLGGRSCFWWLMTYFCHLAEPDMVKLMELVVCSHLRLFASSVVAYCS